MPDKSANDAGSGEREVDAYYDQGYHGVHHASLISEDAYYQSRAEIALGYWEPNEISLKIFDYGCGVGQTIALLPHAEGWDVSSEARDICRAKGLTVYDTVSSVPRAAYDRVICRHVLEHVEEPLETLRTMRALLKPDGQLVLILPVEEHWVPKTPGPDINNHLYCWTPRTIYNLLWRAGFEPTAFRNNYPFGHHRLQTVRRLFGAAAFHALVRIGSATFRRNGEMVIRARVHPG